jgi:hypothetical protein
MTIQVNHSSNAYLFDKSDVVADDDQSAAEAPQRGGQLFLCLTPMRRKYKANVLMSTVTVGQNGVRVPSQSR